MRGAKGHATIELTVSTYGRWLKKKALGALDRLDLGAGAMTRTLLMTLVDLFYLLLVALAVLTVAAWRR